MKRISKIYAVIFALVATFIMALPVSAATEAGKEIPAVSLVTAAKKVNVSKCKITVAKTVAYTGKAVKPKVTVKYGKKTLKKGKHYKITYSSNKKIGTAKIKITGISKGGYTGTKTVSFKIVPAKSKVTVKSSTASTVTLSFKKAKGAKKYVVYRYDSAKKKYIKLGTTSKTTYTVKKLTSAKKYTFAVKSYAKKNYLSDYSAKKSTYTRPAAVKNLVASPAEDSAVLSWDKVTGATGYIVYKVEDGKYTKLATTKALTYTASNLSESADYTYAVAAYVSKTSYLGEKTDVSFATSVSAPDKVSGLTAVIEDGKAVLTWDKTEDADGYTVYLYNNETGEYIELDTFEGRETYSYPVTDGLYVFAVAAYFTEDDSSIYGDYSDTAAVGVPFKAVENLRALSSVAPSVSLIWDKKENAEGYDVYSYDAETKEYTFIVDAGNENTVDITGVEANKTYTYVVNAYYYADGEKISGEYSEPASASTAFGGATNVTPYASSDSSIVLKWNLIKGATSYNVYKKDSETGNYVFVDNTAYRTYTVNGLEEDTTYKFAVSAVRNVDENTFESILTETGDVYYTKTMPSNAKKTYDIFKSGTFGITYAIPYDDKQEISTETYVKNGNFALIANMAVEGLALEAKTLYLKDKNEGYVIVPFGVTGFYTKMTSEDLKGEGMDISGIAESMAPDINDKVPFTVETKEYNGQMCTCESFVSTSGKINVYYFNQSGTLVAIEEIPVNDASSIMKVTKFSSTVDDKVFKLPTAFPFGWTDISSLE